MVTCPAGHAPGESGLADGYCDVCGSRLTGTAGAGAPGTHTGGTGPGGTGAAASSGVPASGGPAPAGVPGGPGRAPQSGPPQPGPPQSGPPQSGPPQCGPPQSGPPQECLACRAPVAGRFCEDCGHDQTAAPDPVGAPGATPVRPYGTGPADGPPGGNGAGSAPSGRASGSGPGGGPAAGWEATVQADRAHYDRMIAQGGPDSERVLFPPYCPRRDIPLAGPEIRIGRPSRSRNLVPEIDLSGPPEDPGVSHLHAVLLPGPGGGWTLVDPGSANGTVVNGRQIGINEPVPVGDGDRIHLGAWTLITLRRRRET